MVSQTRSNFDVTNEIMEGLRGPIVQMIREEMENIRDEMRNATVKANGETVVRNQGDRNKNMQFTRVAKIDFQSLRVRMLGDFLRLIGGDTMTRLVYKGAIMQRFRNSFEDPLTELKNKIQLHILIDSGSTHNFLNTCVAKKVGCKIKTTCPLRVTVAGEKHLSVTLQYRHPHTQKDAIKSMVGKLLESSVIRHSQSSLSSHVVMVKKKDSSWRIFIDYWQLNKQTMKGKFPIPLIEELIDELHVSVVFSKLDLKSGYYHIRMYDDDIAKNAFKTHEGHYEFLAKPFGLTNAPSTFQSLTNESAFGWNDEAQLAFETLKSIVVQVPNLQFPNFNKTFISEIEASDVGVGAVLTQNGHPIAFLSVHMAKITKKKPKPDKNEHEIVKSI
nr:retrotransposon-related protein [Tanacetum cinerariifolium]